MRKFRRILERWQLDKLHQVLDVKECLVFGLQVVTLVEVVHQVVFAAETLVEGERLRLTFVDVFVEDCGHLVGAGVCRRKGVVVLDYLGRSVNRFLKNGHIEFSPLHHLIFRGVMVVESCRADVWSRHPAVVLSHQIVTLGKQTLATLHAVQLEHGLFLVV